MNLPIGILRWFVERDRTRMKISQAIYTSANAELCRGYHLVSRSPGLDEQVAQSLCRWSPSHGCLSEDRADAESLNFFQASPDWFVLSRSVYGCPEFSQRGGLRLVTISLVFHASQLACYENDVIACARIALSTGLLMLPLTTPDRVPQIDFPDRSQRPTGVSVDPSAIADVLKTSRQVALVGVDDPLAILSGLFKNVEPLERLKISFATGLKPSAQRPFRIQFFPSADRKQQNDLIRQGFSVRNCPHLAKVINC